MSEILYCLDASSDSFFDLTLAPSLLYYSYIPVMALLVAFAVFVFIYNRGYLGKVYGGISLSVTLWMLLAIIQWIALPAHLVAYTWQISFILEPIVFLLAFYFVFYFVYNKIPNFLVNTFYLLPMIFFAVILPTKYNFNVFDLTNCENIDGIGIPISYGYELLAVLSILYIILKLRRESQRSHLILVPIAVLVFLSVFLVSNVLGHYLGIYEFNLIGPLGMLAMVFILAISITKYKVFNIKLLLPQVLVSSLLFLNFGILFIKDISLIRIVMIFTILLVAIIGWIMIRSVKQVDRQRSELAISNNEQAILIHFITHQIKGFFTKSRNIFDTLSDEREAFSPSLNRLIDEGMRSDKEGVELVENILHASNLRTGKIKYTDTLFEIDALVKDLIKDLQPAATARNLSINYYAPASPITVKADRDRLKDLIKNLIQNSILYTFKGGVNVSLTQKGSQIEFTIKDTGIGLTESDKSHLFQSGGRGEESVKYNTSSTGYGLFIAKKVVDNYNGQIFAESEGRDKGSKFTVILPIAQTLLK